MNLIVGLVVRCAQLPVLIPQNGPLHEMNAQDCTSDMHCVTDTHHMKALDAFGRVLHHGYGGRGRHYGSIQLVWHAPTAGSDCHRPLMLYIQRKYFLYI